MIIVTSLSPNHSNAANQQAAIDSWQRFGKCFTLNSADEVIKLCNPNGIIIRKIEQTVNGIIGKPMVNINAMIDFGIMHHEDILIINSDILLTDLPEFKYDGITIISRYDYTDNISNSKIFAAGFDVVFIPKKLLTLFPPSIYAMGVAWWDYWIPYRAMLAGVPVYWPDIKCAFHKLHNTQYSQAEWLYIGEYFKWEFRFDKNLHIGQMATKILSKIQTRSIR